MKPNEGIQMRYWTAAAVLVAALVVGGVAGAFATARTGRTPFEAAHTVPVVMATGNNQAASEVSFLAGFSPVMKAVLPAVVNISSTKVIRSPDYAQGSPYFSDPFFRFFFGDEFSRQFNVPRERRERSLGSGVIVSPEGYLLTNNHVVEGADKIKVILADKRELDAKIVGTDPKTDVAVLRVDEKGLPVLPLADSTRVSVGDFALAIGNPFGIGQTAGAASASRITRTSSRPMLRSTRATPAARWSTCAGNLSASTRPSSLRAAVTRASASPYPATWRAR